MKYFMHTKHSGIIVKCRVALQFKVRKCWRTKFGLLIEREVRAEEEEEEDRSIGKILGGKSRQTSPPPVLFALLHPLDDFTRVVNKQGGRLSEWREDTNRLVFTSSTSNLAVSYNISTEQHSVWGVRRANQQEAEGGLFLDPREGETSAGGISHTPSSRDSMKLMGQSCSRSPAWLHSSSLIQSPSLPSRGVSPSSRGASPQPSRNGSPNSAMANLLRGGQSPNTPKAAAARFCSPLHSPRMGEDISMLEDQQMPQPVEVTMCLDHLWTEPCGSSRAEAEKIFLATDCVGQQMICLLSNGSLLTVKMERTNDAGGRVIFGAARKIAALDAAPVTDLNMVLVLESPACLALYTGASRVCVVAIPSSIPNLPAASLSREISALALDSAPGTPVRTTAHLSLDMASAPSTPLNAKRSSLLTSSRPPSATLPTFGEALSPVAGEEGRVVRLRDAISRSLTLVYSSGRMVQITLPDLGSPLVCSALAAVKVLLPRDLALLVHSSWYTARHAPGPPPSPGKEWRMFQSCLLSLGGYQVLACF